MSFLSVLSVLHARTSRGEQILFRPNALCGPNMRYCQQDRLFGLRGGDSVEGKLDGGKTKTKAKAKRITIQQVQVIHRHGDRTPITPMRNESYWAEQLPGADLFEKVSAKTKIVRKGETKHLAGGRGPFGKLTMVGLLQMIELGSSLREELQTDQANEHRIDDSGNILMHNGCLFHPSFPLEPRQVRVFSTDFPRTIQSVQGTLVGLFPDHSGIDHDIEIDAQNTNIMIPDPQPRLSKEQEDIEKLLSMRPHLKEREAKMRDLGIRVTEAITPLLAEDAFEISFGVGEEKSHSLSWAQLAEITKCLRLRGLLPPSISDDDQEAISAHLAWLWFENLRNPRLAYLAMNKMVMKMIDSMQKRIKGLQEGSEIGEAPFYLYSAHDSTLIGLLSAFRLEQPAKWPEYGSYLKIELIEASPLSDEEDGTVSEYHVRFSLNGQVLRSQWEEGEGLDEIPINVLVENAKNVGSEPSI